MPDNVAIDSSTFTPLQTTTAPAAPVAAAPQAAPVAIDSATFTPLQGPQADKGTLGMWKEELVGPDTLLGNAGRIIKGAASDIGKGEYSHAIWGDAAPHVQQGSTLEKMIQRFNPDFKGAGTPETTAATKQNLTSMAETPLVNVADQIDKKQNPLMKVFAEAGQSFLNPENMAIMIGTGGAGMVDSASKLGVANKLLSVGFTAQSIGQMYARFPAIKKAWDDGDSSEALYQAGHIVLSGAMATVAGMHAAGKPMEAVSDTDRAAAGKAVDLLGQAGEAVKGAAGGAGEKIIGAAKRALDLDNSLTDVVRKASPPTRGKAMEYDQTLAAAEPQLRDLFQKNPNVSSPEEMYKAIDDHIKGQEGLLQQKAEQYKGTARAAMPSVVQDVETRLNKAFNDAGGQYTAAERRSAIQSVKDHMLQEVGKDAEGNMMYRNPDLFEVEGVRQRFNNDANPVFGSNAPAIPKAESFAKAEAAKELRNQIDQKYDQLGVQGVKEWRQQEAPLIDVRDQISKAQNKAIEMGEFDAWKSLVKNMRWSTLFGGAAGSHGGLEGSLVGAIAANGLGVLADYIRDVKTNPNRLIQRAAKMANGGGPSGAKNPTFGKINVPYTAEGIQEPLLEVPKSRARSTDTSGVLGHEWGHAIVAHKEGFGVDGIFSHLHPANAGTNTAASTRLDLSNLGVNEAGHIPLEAYRENLDRVLSTIMGGAAADTVHRGVSLEDNLAAYGDKRWAEKLMTALEIEPEESKKLITAGHERAMNHLTDQHARDILLENRDIREPGLDKTMHTSKERMDDVLKELDRRQNEANANNRGPEANNAEHGQGANAGREGIGAGQPEKEAAGGRKGLKEHSTGDEAVDSMIKDAGGIPAGASLGLILFHDPKTGSTLAMRPADITPETLKLHLESSREAFKSSGKK